MFCPEEFANAYGRTKFTDFTLQPLLITFDTLGPEGHFRGDADSFYVGVMHLSPNVHMEAFQELRDNDDDWTKPTFIIKATSQQSAQTLDGSNVNTTVYVPALNSPVAFTEFYVNFDVDEPKESYFIGWRIRKKLPVSTV